MTRFPLRTLVLQLGLSLSLGLCNAAARADDVSDVQALLSQGKAADGLKKIDTLLQAKPNDARLRLQRGIALSQLNRQAEAIAVFQKLIETNPDLPGPYNNLAVIYGSQGDYEKARQALELAIRTNPGYATAFQNLGDVYARLAGQAYKKALALDKGDNHLPLKLAVVQNMFEASVDPRAAKVATQAAAAKPAAATPPTPAVTKPAPAATPAPAPAPVAAKPVAVAAASAPAAPAAPVTPAAKPDNSAAQEAQAQEVALNKAVQAWAQAWSERDMKDYYKAYAPEFKGKSASRKAWEEDRRARIMGKKKIKVELSQLKIKLNGDKASVSFRQDYNSDSLDVKSSKTLQLIKSKSGAWLITQESAG
ncbi:tetratricopeptide (TPR) repeat protein [Paucibacter oligotrophus]|uniref:Tetratricopeptide (TPR) repeat protein n=1 Tax=Roseateles oligotrophus TaxID=1769250 RepID=A0A840L2A2_9BURK|nr:tetratricopeptide (TPR) repeat protein [Roseateles oligotrophus]